MVAVLSGVDLAMTRRKKPVASQTLLLVDSDARSMRMLEVSLRKAGYDVEMARDGEEALAAMERRVPDLILSDWNMPNMTGIEFLNNLRAQGNQTTFGFVTSESNPAMKEQAIAGGAAFLLTKPFDAERLAEVVGAVVSG